MTQLVIPARFNGPARSGNGGFVSGSLAEVVPDALHRAVEVTLRRPPPLDTDLAVTTEDGVTLPAIDATQGPDGADGGHYSISIHTLDDNPAARQLQEHHVMLAPKD